MRSQVVGLTTLFLGLAVLVAPPARAVINYCGTVTYDSSVNGAIETSPQYSASLGKCLIFVAGDSSIYNSDSFSNLALPSFVTSINVYGVGGGGSTAANEEPWWTYYQDNATNYMSSSNSGSGGGGGSSFERTGIPVTSSYRFSLNPGIPGLYNQDFTMFGSTGYFNYYMGSNGGNTVFTMNTGSTTTSITAGGGKAPTSGNLAAGGLGGTVTGSPNTTGWTTNSGSAGLPNYFNNASPTGGTYIAAVGGTVGQGGGSKANGYIGNRGSGYGSGGGGSYIDQTGGQYFPEDLGCYLSNANGGCDGQPGAIALTYSALDYYPVLWDTTSQISVSNEYPVQGQAFNVNNYFAWTLSGYQPSPTPTVNYTWYRCTGTSAGSFDNTGAATGCTQTATNATGSYTPTASDLGYYIQAKIVATNSGTGSSSTITGYSSTTSFPVVTTPAAPTLTSMNSKTPTRLSLNITPSTTWGAGYWFRLVDATTSATLGSATYDGTALAITGLTANTTYNLKVIQVNSAGDSPASSNSLTITTPLAVTASAAPAIATADYRPGTVLSYPGITWSGNSTPTVVRQWLSCPGTKTAAVAYETTINNTSCTDLGSSETLTITSAMVGRHVRVMETATDTFSSTQYGSASVAVTGEMDAPSISAVARVAGSNTSLTIDTALASYTGGSSTITATRVMYQVNGSATWVGPTTYYSSSTRVTPTGLTPGASYVFKVAVRNTVNGVDYYSSYSAPSASITVPRTITASAYGSLTGTPVVGGTISVTPGTFLADATTSIVSSHSWFSCNAAVATATATSVASLYPAGCMSLGPTTGTYTPSATNLNNGTHPHLVVVQGVTDGYSTQYFRYPSLRIAFTPAAPTAVSVSGSGTTSLSVTFTAPTLSGASAISGYKYSYAAGPSFSSWSTPASTGAGTSTSFTISGLSGATEYKVRVSAVNTSGTGTESADSTAVSTYFAPTATGAVVITGTAAVGQVLSADSSGVTVTSNPATTRSYAWYACDDVNDVATLGVTCSVISGETNALFTVTSAQSEKFITVETTETNSVGAVALVAAATAQVPGVPGPVTNVNLTATSRTTIAVTYDLPTFVGGAPIDAVEYQYAAAPYVTWTSFTSAGNLSGSFVISGLTTNTTYKVIVRANNSIGVGESSTASAGVATQGETQISGTLSINGTAAVGQGLVGDESAISLLGTPSPSITARAWYRCNAAQNAGAPVTACMAISGATSTNYQAASSDLGRFLVYQVSASNGTSSATLTSASTTVISSVPSAPTEIDIDLVDSGIVAVSFTAAVANHSAVTDYEYELDGSGTWISVAQANNSTVTLTGFTDGVSNAIRLRAININGPSLPSASHTFTTLSAPTGLSGSHADASVELSWTAVAGATTYAVSVSTSSTTGFAASNCLAVTATSCTITGLENGVDYYFKVTAANANGSSPISVVEGPHMPLSRDATLANLQVKSKASPTSNPVTRSFATPFSSSSATYEVTVPASATSVVIVPEANDLVQFIAINGAPVVSGRASNPISIQQGQNMVTVTVTSLETQIFPGNQYVGTYTINITRPAPDLAVFTGFISNPALTAPTVATFANSGVTGVTTRNLPAINNAIATLSGIGNGNLSSIQTVVDAYSAIIGASYFGGGTAPTTDDYVAIGITQAAYLSDTQLTFLNTLLSYMTVENASEVSNLQTMVLAIDQVFAIASGASSNTLTLEMLKSLGVTGATQETLPSIIAALAATANDGSEVDTLVKIQAVVDGALAVNVSSLVTATSVANSSAGVATYQQAGVSGVSPSNVTAVNNLLASLPSNAKTSAAAIQYAVDALNLILAQAKNADSTTLNNAISSHSQLAVLEGPSHASYLAIGATTAANLNPEPLLLLNSILLHKSMADIDSVVEIEALATIANTIVSNSNTATVTDFATLGIRGVTSANLAVVQAVLASALAADKGSVEEIQALVDQAVALAAITTYANSTATTRVAPSTQNYVTAGVEGVTSATIAALNAALTSTARATTPARSWQATTANVQAIQNGLLANAISTLSNYSGSSTAPALTTYQAAGIRGVTATNLAAINSFVAALPSNATSSVDQISTTIAAFEALQTAATNHTSSSLTLDDLVALGVTGVTSSNIDAVLYAIANTPFTSLNSATALQSVVDAAITASTASTNVILDYVSNTNVEPSVSDYKSAGLIGVSSSNKELIDYALSQAIPAPTTIAEIQAIIDQVLEPKLVELSTFTDTQEVRLADFTAVGITGLSSTNLSALTQIFANLPETERDSVEKIQSRVDSYNFVLSIALGGTNSPATAPKPSVEDFVAIGIELGDLAENSDAFELFQSILSTFSAAVLADSAKVEAHAATISDLVRFATGLTPETPLSIATFTSLGLKGVTSTNLTAVLAELKAAGATSIEAIQAVLAKYGPVPPIVGKVAFSGTSYKVSTAAKNSINATVTTLLRQNVKTITLTTTLKFPAKTSKSTISKAKALAVKRNAEALKVINAKLKASRSRVKATTKVVIQVGSKSQSITLTGSL